jgi:rod shape determining protein RodA
MSVLRNTDWILFFSALLITIAGLLSMAGFGTGADFFERQVVWLGLGIIVFFVVSSLDLRFLRKTTVVTSIYVVAAALLALLFIFGSVFGGAQGWFNFGAFALQPADPAKLALILVLAKYFTRRHIEIAQLRHIFVSGIYALIIMLLLFFQPDFGSAAIVAGVWLGMVLVAGIPARYVLGLVCAALVAGLLLWNFGFAEYQKERILTFVHPQSDIRGSGYNAFQSMVAVGSGGLFGQGIGYGTQSRLQFLPEHETDFIFASFAEEWGFVGVCLLLSIFAVLMYRLVSNARRGETNFESLFILGVATLLIVHMLVHIGSNIGLLPVTGTTLPFMSYGGSHLLIGYAMLGMVNAMRSYARAVRVSAAREVEGFT